MRLTKQQRHIIYCCMLAELEMPIDQNTNDGFCWQIRHSFDITDRSGSYRNVIDHLFPELKNKKPEATLSNGLWFKHNEVSVEGLRKRVEILSKCIEETF